MGVPRHAHQILLPTAFAALLAFSTPVAAQITKAPAVKTKQAIKVETFAKDLVHPWGLAFLPDGRLLVTERPGRLRIVGKDGTLSAPVQGVPKVYASGQGGLLDVELSPDFASTGLIYLSYAEPRGRCQERHQRGAGEACHRRRPAGGSTRCR